MSEPTTRSAELSAAPLLICLLELMAAFRPAFRQERPYRRCVALVFGSLFAFARLTITQVLLALGGDRAGLERLVPAVQRAAH